MDYAGRIHQRTRGKREFVAGSGARMHMVSKKDLNSAEFARVGNDPKRVQVRCAPWMMRVVFSAIRLGPKTPVYRVKVMSSTATGCDVTHCATTLQWFNKHASSRRDAVSDSRGVLRCTEKMSKNLRLLTCVDRSTRPIHYTRIQLAQSLVATVPFAR